MPMWIFAGFAPLHDSLVSLDTGDSFPKHSAKHKLGEAYANRQIFQDIWVNSTHALLTELFAVLITTQT